VTYPPDSDYWHQPNVYRNAFRALQREHQYESRYRQWLDGAATTEHIHKVIGTLNIYEWYRFVDDIRSQNTMALWQLCHGNRLTVKDTSCWATLAKTVFAGYNAETTRTVAIGWINTLFREISDALTAPDSVPPNSLARVPDKVLDVMRVIYAISTIDAGQPLGWNSFLHKGNPTLSQEYDWLKGLHRRVSAPTLSCSESEATGWVEQMTNYIQMLQTNTRVSTNTNVIQYDALTKAARALAKLAHEEYAQ